MRKMPRPPKYRIVEAEPRFTYFKPAGIPKYQLQELVLSVEEVEAIRLKDKEGLEQEECAERMRVSRPTFQRILINARGKLAEAIIEGKAIRVEGGHYRIAGGRYTCRYCQREFEAPFRHRHGHGHRVNCPECNEILNGNEEG